VALAIAVKTWLNDLTGVALTKAEKVEKMDMFPAAYVPYATHLWEDMEICYSFFDAIHAGVKTLDTKELSTSDCTDWNKAAEFLRKRR
jgi:hypothetical protein